MTLCVVWKKGDDVHFAADSRLTVANNSNTDIAIKVRSLQYRIFEPIPAGSSLKAIHAEGEIGICYAGSAVSSLFIIETLAQLMKQLQFIPNYSDTSMEGLAKYMFSAYETISKQAASTVLGKHALAAMAISGFCSELKKFRTFSFTANLQNNYQFQEILLNSGDYQYFGSWSAKTKADALYASTPNADHFSVLQAIIDDPTEITVGGPIQSGSFYLQTPAYFVIYGSSSANAPLKYLYGGLDLNDPAISNGNFISNISFRGP